MFAAVLGGDPVIPLALGLFGFLAGYAVHAWIRRDVERLRDIEREYREAMARCEGIARGGEVVVLDRRRSG